MTGARPRLIVEHQQPGLASARDREHLLLAARHQAGLAVLERTERREVVECGVHVGRVPLAVQPEVLGHGQPGAGKTTLIDAISGFVNSTGTVQLGDRDLRGLPAYERARGGLTRTWQSTELFDDLSVFENLTVAARESGVTEDNAKQTLSLVGMDWAAEAEPLQLSSGQRKLVGVSRALVAKPKLLCLDEPAAGLDTAE
jgi:branched-chain amino acid transport system ATP-binding protein